MSHELFLRRAIEIAVESAANHTGGPFGAVIVKDGRIIAEGNNRVTPAMDPTAHAEIVAIRQAASHLQNFSLKGCEIYTSCEPCPMCLAAIYWARLDRIWFAGSRDEAAAAGFDDEYLYRELALPLVGRSVPTTQLLSSEGANAFGAWAAAPNKVLY